MYYVNLYKQKKGYLIAWTKNLHRITFYDISIIWFSFAFPSVYRDIDCTIYVHKFTSCLMLSLREVKIWEAEICALPKETTPIRRFFVNYSDAWDFVLVNAMCSRSGPELVVCGTDYSLMVEVVRSVTINKLFVGKEFEVGFVPKDWRGFVTCSWINESHTLCGF